MSMEFTRLAQITKQDRFYDSIARITDALEELQPRTGLPGLWSLSLDVSHCSTMVDSVPTGPREPSKGEKCPIKERLNFGQYNLGAQSGSAYEYLPKQWILMGGVEHKYRTMYTQALDAMKKHLLFRPMITEPHRNLSFFASASAFRDTKYQSKKKVTQEYKGSHSACSAGAMIGLAARAYELPKEDMDLAASLTDGCIWAHAATRTGVMPEEFGLLPCESMEGECPWDARRLFRAIDPSAQDTYGAMSNSTTEAFADPDESLDSRSEEAKRRDNITSSSSSSASSSSSSLVTETPALADQKQKQPKGPRNPELFTDEERREIEDKVAMQWNIDQQVFRDLHSWEEYAQFRQSQMRLPDGMTHIYSGYYVLRPEAIESIFYMYRLTGENYWRERGWDMWQHIMATTRTNASTNGQSFFEANSGIFDVMNERSLKTDLMEPSWISATCKYFYLLFSDEQEISLDDFVL